jgi:hypothetical protein
VSRPGNAGRVFAIVSPYLGEGRTSKLRVMGMPSRFATDHASCVERSALNNTRAVDLEASYKEPL